MTSNTKSYNLFKHRVKMTLKAIGNMIWLNLFRRPLPESDDSQEIMIGAAQIEQFTLPDLSPLKTALSTGKIGGMHGHALFLFNLTRETKAKLVVEIGLGDGDSSTAFLLALHETNGKLVSIDIEDKPEAKAKLQQFGLAERWEFIQIASEKAVKNWSQHDPIDILLIDGLHSYDQVYLEYQLYKPLMRSGGYILFHDSVNLKGVVKFIKYLEKRGQGGINFPFSNGLYVIQV